MNKEYFEQENWTSYLELIKSRPESFRQNDLLRIITDESTVLNFMKKTGKLIGVLYKSRYSILIVDLVCDKNGRLFEYERMLPAVESGAVVTIPHYGNSFILLKQFRHSIRAYQLAFPRGFGKVGLDTEENAAKELKEELGAEVISSRLIGTVVADSGLLGNQVDVVECEINRETLKYGYEGITEILSVSGNELERLISDGNISDGYTLAAWALYNTKDVLFK